MNDDVHNRNRLRQRTLVEFDRARNARRVRLRLGGAALVVTCAAALLDACKRAGHAHATDGGRCRYFGEVVACAIASRICPHYRNRR